MTATRLHSDLHFARLGAELERRATAAEQLYDAAPGAILPAAERSAR